MIETGELLEWAEIFGHRSGTPAEPSSEDLAAGRDVILEIDVQGARHVRERVPEAVLILLEPPTHGRAGAAAPRAGHRDRGEASPGAWPRPRGSWRRREWFDHVIVNDDVERAAAEVAAIIEAARSLTSDGLCRGPPGGDPSP